MQFRGEACYTQPISPKLLCSTQSEGRGEVEQSTWSIQSEQPETMTFDRGAILVHTDPLIQRLIGKLNDEDPVVRRNAAGALRLHGARALAAVPELRRLLADRDSRVRNEAQHALDRLERTAA